MLKRFVHAQITIKYIVCNDPGQTSRGNVYVDISGFVGDIEFSDFHPFATSNTTPEVLVLCEQLKKMFDDQVTYKRDQHKAEAKLLTWIKQHAKFN
jgi:hypothetical protein